MAALYNDEWLRALGIHPDGFESAEVERLIEKTREAVIAVNNPRAIAVAKEWFALSREANRKRRKQTFAE